MKGRPFVILFLSLIASALSLDVNTTSVFHFTLSLCLVSNGVTVTAMILTWPIDRPSCDHCRYKSC